MSDVEIVRAEDRYEVHVDGERAGFTEAHERDGVVVMPHTEIDDAYSGQGLAGRLVRFALDDIRGRGLTVDPRCPYVKGWIDKHPDYQDLLAPHAD